MALKTLPLQVQSKFSASSQIRSFRTAVEELVYNALDANSSSIAIRVNIKENYIQLVDNGNGIVKDDFELLGQRHTTSKYENCTKPESLQMYGCCGQSLANLIEVSQSVKIISRSGNEGTWMKHFSNGKYEGFSAVPERPSIGTTVEIKGFLYNLTIQKKAVKALQELQNIKTFIEQISLVHCNISISLRDNSENEIIYKINKNRNFIQTLSSVLNIDTTNLHEFQVEKNQYKVTGFIHSNNEEAKGYQWIYVNGRFIKNSNLQKNVNEGLAKGTTVRSRIKTKSVINENEKVASNRLPDYFLFITCPKSEYDIISNPKHSMLEFKNVLHIRKLLEKLVKFHMGDVKIVKAINPPEEQISTHGNKEGTEMDTRNKVKQIMKKILGSQNKLNGSNMRNGVKGKIMKRKKTKTVRSSAKCKLNLKHNSVIEEQVCEIQDIINVDKQSMTSKGSIDNEAMAFFRVPRSTPVINKKQNTKPKQIQHKKAIRLCGNTPENKYDHTGQPIIFKFQRGLKEVHKRCSILTKRVNHLLGVEKKRKRKIFTNEIVQYRNFFTDTKSISVRQKINEVIIHEYFPLPQKGNATNKNDRQCNIKKSNDLLQPVIHIISQNNLPRNATHVEKRQLLLNQDNLVNIETSESKIPGPTYESHCYLKDEQNHGPQVNIVEKCKKNQFISIISRDNLASPTKKNNIIKKRINVKRPNHRKIGGKMSADGIKSSLSADFTQTLEKINEKREIPENYNSPNADKNFAGRRQKAKKLQEYKINDNIFTDAEKSSYYIHFTQSDSEMKLNKNDNSNRISKDRSISPIADKNLTEKKKETLRLYHNMMNDKIFTNAAESLYSINFTQTDYERKLSEKRNIPENYHVSRIAKDIAPSHNSDKNIVKERNETKLLHSNDINDNVFADTTNSSYICFNQTQTKMKENREIPISDESSGITFGNNDTIGDNTYVITHSKKPEIRNLSNDSPETRNEDASSNHYSKWIPNSEQSADIQKAQNEAADTIEKLHNVNVVFISNTQKSNFETNSIDPLNVCEVVIGTQNKEHEELMENTIIFDSINDVIENNIIKMEDGVCEHLLGTADIYRMHKDCSNIEWHDNNYDFEAGANNEFNLKNRPRYLPKGMSPIFEKCYSKNVCDHGPVGDYFEENVYNNFVQNVQINSEIFQPKIQYIKEATTRDVHKKDIKLNKNNACLKFNSESLKHAKVLGQVDNKFIATTMIGHYNGAQDCLVLFDQHAVHERIRLEQNMSEYFTHDQWKSILVDDFTLKLTRDEILYLHNHRDKFERFGIQWCIASPTQVLVTAIPEAILGKHQRQVGIVLQAVKSLIKEEINIIKQQGGCVSLYPKSIMDLVFSEACRYAIMFGTALHARECSSLIEALSHCRTPFQCAHGRPALAVLVDVARETRSYTVNFTKVEEFCRKQKIMKK